MKNRLTKLFKKSHDSTQPLTEFDKIIDVRSREVIDERANAASQMKIARQAAEIIEKQSRWKRPGDKFAVNADVPDGIDPADVRRKAMELVRSQTDTLYISGELVKNRVAFHCRVKSASEIARDS